MELEALYAIAVLILAFGGTSAIGWMFWRLFNFLMDRQLERDLADLGPAMTRQDDTQ